MGLPSAASPSNKAAKTIGHIGPLLLRLIASPIVTGISKDLPGKTAVEQAVRRAMMAIQSGRPNEAERLASDVLKMHPQHPRALHVFGYAVLMQGRPHDSVAALEQAARSLRDPAIEMHLSVALRQIGRSNDALSSLTRATKCKPPFPPAFYELGYLLFSMQRFKEAIETLKQGVALTPTMPDLWAMLGSSLQSLRLLGGDDSMTASAAFERALTIAPNHEGALYGMGLVLMDEQKYAQAAKHLRRALVLNPTHPPAHLNLGVCLLELQQHDAALTSLRTAVAGGPQFFGQALKALISSGHGRFWLRPSDAAKFLKQQKI